MDNPLSQTISVFAKIARWYADNRAVDTSVQPYLRQFISALPENGPVLDVGCGCGRDVRFMAEEGIEAVGMDLCREMLEPHARLNAPGSVFRHLDLRSTHYPPRTFAGIWACACLHFLEPSDMIRALRSLAAQLIDRGVLYAIVDEGEGTGLDESGRWRKAYRREEFCGLLESAGFTVDLVQADTLPHPHDAPGGRTQRKWLRVLARKTRSFDSPTTEDECLFCPPNRFKINRRLGLPGASAIFWGNEDVFVIPDVAPLVEGHLLIVSAAHYSCYGAAPAETRQALRCARTTVRDVLRQAYHQPVLFFEHGSVSPYGAGACIDHAHWHCIPAEPLARQVDMFLGNGRAADIDDLPAFEERRTSYLYIEDDAGGRVFEADRLPCQFMRLLLAKHCKLQLSRWQELSVQQDNSLRYNQTVSRLMPLVDQQFPQAVV